MTLNYIGYRYTTKTYGDIPYCHASMLNTFIRSYLCMINDRI